ncbi:VOC family protein [Cryobacterium psychrophilum]|uniref:VOC family protein n=1 Tax=Cryobacterium psychrophilum TaxID=41988 RepID=A0A4Y8KPK6_9MICO|nr:VOC family protein [Cryobacterium psychrophilum]TDW29500.1 catechol 2,3-dioxygenase-like lactoylglutathione lyase family enzyme [Cryobacterium psychrophilum]TFD74999.1 VOC family protein [Cryobacterium psychrophilum]
MFTNILVTPMYVTDQDQALAFYVDKLGFEVETDADLGNMRWLTVRLPSRTDRVVLLQRIGDQSATGSPETAEMLRELTERGTSSWMILTTNDCHDTYRKLTELGVEIIQEPTEQMYGTDMAIRDPFGNQIRITQMPSQGEESAPS